MTKVVKEFLLDNATGEVSVEYDDNSTSKYNLSNAVTVTQSAQGVGKTLIGDVQLPSVGTNLPVVDGVSQSRKIGFKTATDRFDIFTRGGPAGRSLWMQMAINWGDATAGVSIGTAWAFWRMGLVRACTAVIAGRYTPDAVTGTWTDVDYGVTTGEARATGYAKRSSTAGDTAQFNNVTFRADGTCDVYIRGTSGSANRFEIEVDGTVQLANLVATQATPTTLKFTLTATPGAHTVRLRNTNTGGGTDKLGILAVGGINLATEDVPAGHPIEGVFVEWNYSEHYAFSTGTMGAWEYAFDRAADGVFGGNFHGGEVATSAAVFKLDGAVQGVAALSARAAGYVFTTLEIFQHTTIDSALVTTSRHSLPSDYHWQFDFQSAGSWLTKNAYWCMTPAGVDFTTVTVPESASLTMNGTRVPFADFGRIVQQNSKGQSIETEWTQTVADYGDSFGGKPNIWPSAGNYCKVYKGVYAAAVPFLLSSPSASARRCFR